MLVAFLHVQERLRVSLFLTARCLCLWHDREQLWLCGVACLQAGFSTGLSWLRMAMYGLCLAGTSVLSDCLYRNELARIGVTAHAHLGARRRLTCAMP